MLGFVFGTDNDRDTRKDGQLDLPSAGTRALAGTILRHGRRN
jgi:hypothetical protein